MRCLSGSLVVGMIEKTDWDVIVIDGGNIGLESDGDLTYNPSTGTVTATIFKGNNGDIKKNIETLRSI